MVIPPEQRNGQISARRLLASHLGGKFFRMATKNPNTDTTVSDVARHVVAVLEAAGISRLDASKRTGIPRETFYRKAAGNGKPFDVEELSRIAALVGLTVSDLIAGSERAA